MSVKMSQEECRVLLEKAVAAGQAAGNAKKPNPMYIAGYVPVMDGVCGFASVIIKPASCAFAKYVKQVCRTYPNYGGGLCLPIHEYNQSMEKKEAHAYAMAEVIREAGIKCWSESRID